MFLSAAGKGGLMITKEKEELLNYYNLGLTAYKQRKWEEAIKSFQKALQIDPKDGPSAVYLERSKAYSENPPPDDWDGVFVMTTK
jgi:tetratricopeptide (TPR) repeat protein